MQKLKVKSVRLISSKRMDEHFYDLGLYEENEVESLNIIPRKIVKVKAKCRVLVRGRIPNKAKIK